MGYHVKNITKGTLGELSKIREELEEVEDAERQQNRVLVICELCDMIGAIDHYLEKNFSNFTIKDLHKMANATKLAFKDGTRK